MNQQAAFRLTVRRSSIDGKGCFTAARISRGSRLAQYAGERITHWEAERRRRRGKNRICAVDTEWCIDGSVGGNGTQYINHSCEPNCGLVIAGGQIAIFALRDIAPGEEITVDYLDSDDFAQAPCRCQSANCRQTRRFG